MRGDRVIVSFRPARGLAWHLRDADDVAAQRVVHGDDDVGLRSARAENEATSAPDAFHQAAARRAMRPSSGPGYTA